MEPSRDELRRQLRAAERAHAEALPRWREALARAFLDDRRPAPGARADLLLGGLARRRFLQVGGLTVATAAVLAACADERPSGNVPTAGLPAPTTGLPERSVDDIVLLRTASSLERSLMSTYDEVLTLVPADVRTALELFRDHHEAHASSAERATQQAGGQAFDQPNPVFQAGVVEPTLQVIGSEADPAKQAQQVVIFAHGLENIAASTYQASVAQLSQASLRQAAMSVGTVEARHAAVLAGFIDDAQPVAGLDTLDAAPTTAGSTTTTAVAQPEPGASTTTTSPVLAVPATGVFQVPGAFGSLAESLGPNSYMYDERTLTTTKTG